jgi:hypothetical protein
VYNRCLADGGTSNCLALVNFWRILSNLSLAIDAAGQDSYRASANFWAVSRAATTCYSPQASTRTLTWSVYAMAISHATSAVSEDRTDSGTAGRFTNGVWHTLPAPGRRPALVGRPRAADDQELRRMREHRESNPTGHAT